MSMRFRYPFVAGACLILALVTPTYVPAAAIINWTATDAGDNLQNADTSSPSFSPSSGSGTGGGIYASFGPIILADLDFGDSIVLSTSVVVTGGTSGGTADQGMRFGIFDNNGSATDTNWLGYLAVARASSSPSTNSVFERNGTGGITFGSVVNGGGYLPSVPTVSGTLSGTTTYDFSLTVTKEVSGLAIQASFIGSNGYNMSISVTDTTPNAGLDQFNRVGLVFAGNYAPTSVAFSNIDVSVTPVPEPSAAPLLAGALLVVPFLARRRASDVRL